MFSIVNLFKIDAYSVFSVLIRYVHTCFLAESAFDGLQLAAFSQFNFIVENANSVSLGRNLLNRIQLGPSSNFLFQLDQIGEKVPYKENLSKNEMYDDNYEDNDYNDYGNFNTVKWFCVPEGFIHALELSESAIAQVHFTQFDCPIFIDSKAFDELQLNENSKFQILVDNLNSHLVLSPKAINLVRISDGMFEFWIENHKQNQNARGNSKNIYLSKASSLIELFQKSRHTYVKLSDDAFSQIFLGSRSLFRLGFSNSDSVFSLSPKAINSFHEDRFVTNMDPDYRTKISIELKNSENFRFESSTFLKV